MTLLTADGRGYLTTQLVQRYELANDDSGAAITSGTADDYGCLWLWEEPDGWDSPEVETPLDRRPHEHGAALGGSSFTERVLTIHGSAACPSPADALRARKRLIALTLSSLYGYLRYTHHDDEPGKSLYVRPTGKPQAAVTDGWLDFSLVLIAEDPIKHGTTDTYGPTGLRPATDGGFTTPWTMPLQAAAPPGAARNLRAPNDGDEDAHTVYQVVGPVPGPSIVLSTGEHITLNLTLGASDRLEVDTRAGSVTVNGLSRFDAWGAGSTMPLIPPGGTDVRLESTSGGTDPAAELYVTTAPAWK